MNELEKMPSPEQEGAIPTPENTEVNPENTEAQAAPAAEESAVAAQVEVTETPATEKEEAAACDAQDVCAETSSPAMDLAEAADQGESRNWHDMSKEELIDALKDIVDNDRMDRHKDVAAIKQAFHALRAKELDKQMADFLDAGNAPDAFAADPDEAEYQFKDLYTKFKEGRAQFLANEDERLKENLGKKREIIDQIKNIVEDIDNINLHFPKFQELQAAFKEIKDVPPTDETDIWKEFQSVTELFYDRLKMNKELRDLDFRKNLETKREFIEKAKALTELPDVVAAFRQLQDLHAKWRETGPVAKEYRESIWEEFSAVSTVINKKHQQYFEDRKANEKANEEAKTKLCEEIEALDFKNLDSFNKWEEMTKKVLDLQAQWKNIGFASRKVNNQLFTRFRKTCDEFFAAKAEYYKSVKDELAANLEKKTRLCEQVEALLEDPDRNKNADKVIALQAEWKTIGGVARRQSDAIWQRFTTACNKFFEERKRRNSAVRKEESDNLQAKRRIIEELRAIDPAVTDRNEGLPIVRQLQERWQNTGHVPYKMKDKLYEEYRAECDRIYDTYQASGSRRRMSNFENRIGAISGDGKLSRERERLYRAYEQKRAELKTYENNMGFFNVKSKDGNAMVREMERKISRIKEDLNDLKKKIELIDEKMN